MASAERVCVVMGQDAGHYAAIMRTRLAARGCDCTVVEHKSAADKSVTAHVVAEQYPQASVVLASHATAVGDIALFKAVELVQIPFTGYSWFDWTTAGLGPDALVCNCFEHETAIAEFVLCAILEWEIQFSSLHRAFRADGWQAKVPAFQCQRRRGHGEVRGKTLGVVGFGHIGEEVALRAAAFGMRVLALKRTAPDGPAPNTAWVGGSDSTADVDRVLAESDYLLLACSLTEGTRGWLGRERLAPLKGTAVVINVARGPVIDEQALFEALSTKAIGGAVLDCWWKYPAAHPAEIVRASALPFHELDNCLGTPHASGWTLEQQDRRMAVCADNIASWFAHGSPARLANHVPKAKFEHGS